jgi:RNA polymerase primary sigma factor
MIKEKSSFDLYLKELSRIPKMNTQRELEIKKLINDDTVDESVKDELKKEIVTGHLRFVIQQAKRFIGSGIEFEDLIAEGNDGLLSAIESFDWKRGTKFNTHAIYWIRAKIYNAINNNSRVIRLPHNISQQLSKEIIKRREKNVEMSDEMTNLPTTTDLFRPIGEDSTLLDVINNDRAELADSQAIYNSTVEYLLSKLNDRDKNIVKLLYGIEGKQLNMDEIAEKYDMNKESIRLIKNRSLKKMEQCLVSNL